MDERLLGPQITSADMTRLVQCNVDRYVGLQRWWRVLLSRCICSGLQRAYRGSGEDAFWLRE
jgi:hypothetical protein